MCRMKIYEVEGACRNRITATLTFTRDSAEQLSKNNQLFKIPFDIDRSNSLCSSNKVDKCAPYFASSRSTRALIDAISPLRNSLSLFLSPHTMQNTRVGSEYRFYKRYERREENKYGGKYFLCYE